MFEPRNQPPESTENSLTIVFQGGQLVSDMRSSEPCLLPQEVVQGGNWTVVRQQFLGFWQGRPCYAVEIDELSELDAKLDDPQNLRRVKYLSDEYFALLRDEPGIGKLLAAGDQVTFRWKGKIYSIES